jgi:hypothetical protein
MEAAELWTSAPRGLPCGVASTFLIGFGAVGVALARLVFSLISGVFRFLIGLVRTTVAMVWVLLKAIFGRRD